MRQGTSSRSELTSGVLETVRPPRHAQTPQWLAMADSAAPGIALTRARMSGSGARAPGAASNCREATYLDLVASMLAVPEDEIAMARLVLNALGDPLGQIVLEHLSRGPHDTFALIEKTAREYDAIRYQIRKLLAVDAISRLEHFYYLANPHAPHAIRSYVDVLLTLSSYTKSRSEYHVH
jgi:hypothetical protein